MEENKPMNTASFEDDRSDFDLMEWVMKILSYWYLFVIGLVIALGLATLQNRKWVPQYLSSGTLIIESSNAGYSGSHMLMQGFGVEAGYKNQNNQVVMLKGYDLMARVVDSLPFMHVEYITKGRFKTHNLYAYTPFVIETSYVNPQAYGRLFEADIEDGVVHVSNNQDEDRPFAVDMVYGEPVNTELFGGIIWPTDMMVKSGKIHFRFRDKGSLVDEFQSRIGVNFVGAGTSILQVSLASETPQRDCDFIDKLCELFLQDNLNRKNDAADKSIRFINQQLALLQQSLTVSEGAMTDFRQENKFVDVGSYAGTLMAKMETYDAQEMALRLKETYLNYLEKYLKTNLEDGGVAAPSSLGLNEPMLLSLVQQLNDLRIQRGELSEKNVYYAKYTKDIENVKDAINEVVKSMRASLEIEKSDLSGRYAQVQSDLKKLPEKELQMVAIERTYRIDDNYYTFFLQKRAEAEIQKAGNTPDNDILDKARTTALVNGTQKKKTMMRYLFIGLIIPLLLVVLSELLNTKIRTPKEVEKLSDFPLLGWVRHAKSQNPTLVKSSPRSSYADMLRNIRTRIEFVVQRKTGISIVVTSTQSGDGKTFFSTNMAALYAMTGKRTLLMDLDIRKPNIHERLGIDNGPGVVNYIIGDCSLEDIILTDTPFDFDVIRVGTIPPNPGELIRSDKLMELFRLLKQRYDFIVMDSSPIGQVPDAYALVEETDLTLFVVRCMQTNRFAVKNTLQNLALDHKDKIHLILGDVPTERRGLKYGYGGSYGGYSYGGSYGYGYGSYNHKKRGHNYYAESEEV